MSRTREQKIADAEVRLQSMSENSRSLEAA
ncbi:mobilization protein [Escherichia coli]|nr:mobilization protein [Escherichia coli]